MLNDIRTTKELIELAKKNQEAASVLLMGLLPFLALEIDGSLNLLKTMGIELNDLPISMDYQDTLKKVRIKSKLYREKTKKNIGSIKKIRIGQNEVFSNALKFKFFKKMNWFYDLGTYKYKDIYIGNTYLYIWHFDGIDNVMESININEQQGETIQNFAEAMGQLIGIVEASSTQIPYYENHSLKGVIPGVNLKDFNISKINTAIFKNEIDKDCVLLLFNLLCSVNFVEFYLKNIFNNENSLYFRIKYLIYYFVVSSLESLARYSEQNMDIQTGLDKFEDEIKKTASFKNLDFCNCMRHYGITELTLPEKYINLNEPLLGLIQAHFKLDSLEFINQLDELLIRQSEMLSHWIMKSPVSSKQS
jgi:hypothetical protein